MSEVESVLLHRAGHLAAGRLPNEVLFHIFVLSAEDDRPLKSNGNGEDDGDAQYRVDIDIPGFKRKKLGWTKLMLVCRRWRDVAVATPALWRTIDVARTSSNWMKLALNYSGHATIDVSFPFDLHEEHVSLLLPRCHRLRSLRVQFWPLYALPLISDLLPALETLEIYYPLEAAHNRVADLGITRERFPSLRCLRLAFTVIPRDTSFYKPLRKLVLAGCLFETSLEQFVEVLAGSPSLEHLELHQFLQQLSDGENVRPRRSLPSLVCVCIYSHAPVHSTRFLSRIALPSSSAEIAVRASLYDEGDRGETICACVPPDLANTLPSVATFTWARLTAVFAHGLWTIEGHPTKREPSVIPLILLSMDPRHVFDWEHRMSGCLDDLLEVFGAASLTHLEVIGVCATVTAETWAAVFQAFPCLVSLEADAEGALFDGLHAASLGSPTPDNPESQTLACRSLEHISLVAYCSGFLWTPEPVLEPLVVCLRDRAEKGTCLKELYMNLHMRMDSVRRYLPQLEDLVSEVALKCPG